MFRYLVTKPAAARLLMVHAVLLLAACGAGAATSTSNAIPTSAPVIATTAAPVQQNNPATSAATLAATAAPMQQSNTATRALATTAPAKASAVTVQPTTAATSSTAIATNQPATSSTKPKLNLNSASGNDYLATIPGFGNNMVREFLEYRPYTSILQFRQEMGKYVNAQQVTEYEKYVYVPINVNSADAATLQQIPGLDANEAAALVAGRPYATPDVFLSKLTGYVSADELVTAKTLLSNP